MIIQVIKEIKGKENDCNCNLREGEYEVRVRHVNDALHDNIWIKLSNDRSNQSVYTTTFRRFLKEGYIRIIRR